MVADDLEADERQRIRANAALLGEDPGRRQFLWRCLLTADDDEFVLLRNLLQPYASAAEKDLWNSLQDNDLSTSTKRFNAGMALAHYVPESHDWTSEDYSFLASQLVWANSEEASH